MMRFYNTKWMHGLYFSTTIKDTNKDYNDNIDNEYDNEYDSDSDNDIEYNDNGTYYDENGISRSRGGNLYISEETENNINREFETNDAFKFELYSLKGALFFGAFFGFGYIFNYCIPSDTRNKIKVWMIKMGISYN